MAVKICGINGSQAAEAAVRSGADYLGLVFAPSVRQVSLDRARQLVRRTAARWVGVFVDPDPAAVLEAAAELDLAALQLHGSESPERCGELRSAAGRPVWKALPWTGGPDPIQRYDGAVDAVLLDTGRPLAWSEIAARFPPAARSVPLLLAGGLDPENVGQAIALVRPDGVDASSRLESAPGVKDPVRMRAFAAAASRAAPAEDVR
ncbi:MAG TPA: phosphoribosylanthranilate isomerase [Gemmatimonadota bacterium]|nr:phosphoribosylanthranilate isomerase [Gemmatimonadota bacterium]